MRVLHAYKVYVPGIYGGIPSIIAMLAGLSRSGFDTEILVARDRGFARKYEVDGVRVDAVGSLGMFMSMPLAPTYPFQLARRARHFDIVVHHAPFPLTDLGVLFLPKDVALVVHWHAEVIGRPRLTSLLAPLVRHTLRRAQQIVVGDQTIIDASPFLRPFAEKCVVVPYACNVEYWTELTASQRKTADDLKRIYPRLVVAIGRLVGYKGYEVLLRAIQETDAQAVIVGDGPLRDELNELALKLGIQDRVKFLGLLHPDDVKPYIHAARMLAFPSVTEAESFGIVQLEAMSAARPVVNTNLPTAVPVVARDGMEALTVPVGDPSAFASAISKLLDDPEAAAMLGAAGQKRARAEYDQPLFLKRMQEVYRKAFSRADRTR